MPSGIASSLTVGAWQHSLPDGLNSVRGVVSDALAVLETVTYTPYGVPDTALTATDFAFTGEIRDANGLQYHRARYYDPALAVWGSLDPFEGLVDRPMSLNGYSWVSGNPVNNVDPSGLQEPISTGTVILIFGVLAAAAVGVYAIQNTQSGNWDNDFSLQDITDTARDATILPRISFGITTRIGYECVMLWQRGIRLRDELRTNILRMFSSTTISPGPISSQQSIPFVNAPPNVSYPPANISTPESNFSPVPDPEDDPLSPPQLPPQLPPTPTQQPTDYHLILGLSGRSGNLLSAFYVNVRADNRNADVRLATTVAPDLASTNNFPQAYLETIANPKLSRIHFNLEEMLLYSDSYAAYANTFGGNGIWGQHQYVTAWELAVLRQPANQQICRDKVTFYREGSNNITNTLSAQEKSALCTL